MNVSNKFLLLMNEANVCAELIAHGVYWISKVNRAEPSFYYLMLFNLSIGLERCLKLTIILDSLCRGISLTKNKMKSIGHNLESLFNYVFDIASNYPTSQFNQVRISDEIHQRIIQSLSRFANGDRYYNLDALVERGANNPIEDWNSSVVDYIVVRHLGKIELSENLKDLASHVNENTFFLFNDVATAEEYLMLGIETPIVERYVRLHFMQIVRELIVLIVDISDASQKKGNMDIPFMSEIFSALKQPDKWYLNHKTYYNRPR